MNPYAMAASTALESLGKVADYQMQNRMYNRDKQQANRQETQGVVDRMNAQRMQAGRTPGMQYLLKQMAMRLGLGDMPIQATRQLAIKPVSGTTRVDQQFKNYYGGARPQPQPRPNALQSLLGNYFGGR